MLYEELRSRLGLNFTEPPGYPNYHRFRLVDMYVRASSAEMKKKVLTSFTETNSKLRIVIATIAFSMGMDCPGIHSVIHYGPPSSVEQVFTRLAELVETINQQQHYYFLESQETFC